MPEIKLTPIDDEHAMLQLPVAGVQFGTSGNGVVIQTIAPVPMQLFKQLTSSLALPPEVISRAIGEGFVQDQERPPVLQMKVRRAALTDEANTMLTEYEKHDREQRYKAAVEMVREWAESGDAFDEDFELDVEELKF